MKNAFIIITFLLMSLSAGAQQPFTFECFCGYITAADSNCDVCNSTTQARLFRGLLVRRGAQVVRWIDEPYIITRSFNSLTFRELIPNGEQTRIDLAGTSYTTMEAFMDSVSCPCAFSAIVDSVEVAVDTPMIGTGTTSNPITIGQFGADTTMFLRWHGSHWLPSRVKFRWIENNLPKFKNDTEAISSGLSIGEIYILDTANTLAMPFGVLKEVVGCGFACGQIKFYANSASAQAAGVPPGKQFAAAKVNFHGVQKGFVLAVMLNEDADSLICNSALPAYANNAAAQAGGLSIGDEYITTATNTYGAPEGCAIVVSDDATEQAGPVVCCDVDANLPYFDNDADAIAGGLSAGNYYYLSNSNTYGWPAGQKKRII